MDHLVNSKELRNFGLLVGGIFCLIGSWPLIYRGEPIRLWAIVLGGMLVLLGGLVPTVLSPVFKVWMKIGHVLGWINTRILLGIVFYGLVTPLGLLFRMMGKDKMRLAMSETYPTYRVTRNPRPRSHMDHQF
jgi:hypothetical protein